MRHTATLYLVTVPALAVAILGFEFGAAGAIWAEVAANWGALAWCVGIALIAEAMAVDFNVRGRSYQARSSLAFLPFLSALTISVPGAILVIVFVNVISQFGLRRGGEFLKKQFNVSQGVIAAYCAGTIHRVVLPELSAEFTLAPLVAFTVMAATFFLTNMLLASIAVALLRGGGIIDTFRGVVGPNGANLWYDLLASPIAMIPAVLYQESHVTGMVIVLLPLLLIQYSYLSKQQVIDRSRDLLRALVKAIETRDAYTSGHSLRVATMAKQIALDMGLSLRRVRQVELAALLHDIGKIHPEFAAVLSKPYQLTPEERELIQTHAAKGADLLRELKSVSDDVVASVRHHHEHYDGSGYPDGIGGDSIPLGARIIMMCDSVDAMLSDRPYRKALSLDHVRGELSRCSGSQFDPAIVEVVLSKDSLQKAMQLVNADTPAEPMEFVTWS